MATIRDVAKACGVSAMTISAVVNNRPGFASAETRERVLKVIDEMGYQPNAIARGLTNRRMNTLGVVMSYQEKSSLTSDRYYSPILDGILAANKRHRQKTLIITEDTDEDVETNLLSYLDGRCDGLIFILPLISGEAFRRLEKRKVATVVVGEGRLEEFVSVADMDNIRCGFDATAYLIGLGHRRIGYLSGDQMFLSSAQREVGYRQACSVAGWIPDPRWIRHGRYNVSSGYEDALSILDLPVDERPTALFCGDDAIALGAFQALQERGLKVPDGMSVVGVNDDREAASLPIGLTTVRQPLYRIGESAVEMVLARLAGEMPAGEKRLLPGELICRASAAPPGNSLLNGNG